MILILIITIQGFTSNTTNAKICFKEPKLPGTSNRKFKKAPLEKFDFSTAAACI